MRFLIKFSYDGTLFHGFEKQPNYRSIQDEMEKALKYINNGTDTKLVASGRTDKGVHAKEQTAHVDILVKITEEKLKRALNSLLPEDIHVNMVTKVNADFHARYMVSEKIYEYKINMGEYEPIFRNYIYQLGKQLDINKIEEGLSYFLGRHDFKSFTPNKDKRVSYVREIYEAKVKKDNNLLIFTFRGNGFLKYQIRNMVGLLIQIGLRKKEPKSVLKILEGKNRSAGYKTAPPEGLYLVKVNYK